MELAKALILAICVVCVSCFPAPLVSVRNCRVSDFQLQENLSLERFMGTWYVIAHVQRTHYPYQRRSHYGFREDGTLSMRTDRILRPSDCNPWHFEATGRINAETQNPAKLLVYPPTSSYPPEDYWVVSTDYEHFAFVYSCGQKRPDGSCTKRGEHAWLMGRSPGDLGQEIRSRVSGLMSDVCIRPERLRDVPRECEQELTQDPAHLSAPLEGCQDGNGDCSQGSTSPHACAISAFQLQRDFVIEKFLGEWYEIAHTRLNSSALKVPDMRSLIFSRDTTSKQDADLALLMKDIKLDGMCVHMDMPGMGWLSDNDPAKMNVQFPIPVKYGVSGQVEYWVLSTDYINYAVTYSCHSMLEDGTCDKRKEALWVLSRTRTLPHRVGRQVDEVIRGVCLDPVYVTEDQDVCYTANLAETNDTDTDIIGQAAVTSGCDPAMAKYGCCLLNNRPATGPNYQGCPRIRPPVAGQNIDMRPISEVVRPHDQPIALALMAAPLPLKVKPACDEKIICKMYCEHGFKKDDDNCDICLCAEPPVMPTAQNMTKPSEKTQGEGVHQTKMASCLHQAKSVTKLGQPALDCEPDGSFAPIQCHSVECWCVDQTTGVELSGTRVAKAKPVCDNAPPPSKKDTKPKSNCRVSRLAAQSTLDTQEGSGNTYLPICDDRGNYEHVQCYLETDICWCADTITGERLTASNARRMLACAP